MTLTVASAISRLATVLAPPLCWGCGGEDAESGLCRRCRRRQRWLLNGQVIALGDVALWAPLAYEGPSAALVRALKYRGASALADPMAAQIVANAPADMLDRDSVLVPVPLHPRRRRRRGYNQAALLAVAVAGRRGLPSSELLVRSGPATRQVGRDRAHRVAGIEGSVAVRAGARAPARVVLVDDVVTTGATLAACAAALRRAGADDVRAVAFARTPAR